VNNPALTRFPARGEARDSGGVWKRSIGRNGKPPTSRVRQQRNRRAVDSKLEPARSDASPVRPSPLPLYHPLRRGLEMPRTAATLRGDLAKGDIARVGLPQAAKKSPDAWQAGASLRETPRGHSRGCLPLRQIAAVQTQGANTIWPA
jgi:hypothetical protein